MKVQIYSCTLCLLFSIGATAQTLFNEVYESTGSEQATMVIQVSDGGYIVCGSTNEMDGGLTLMYLVKFDPMGSLIWERTFPSMTHSIAHSVRELSDGGLIIAGGGTGLTDSLTLIKTDAIGEQVWIERYMLAEGSNVAYDVRPTSNGGFIFCGQYRTNIGTTWLEHMIIGKTDEFGDLEWHHILDLDTRTAAKHAFELPNGGYLIGGSDHLYSYTPIFVRLTSAGDLLWVKEDTTHYALRPEGMDLTDDGGFILTGRRTDGPYDIFLRRYNAQADTIWTRTFGTSVTSELGTEVRQLLNGDFIVATTGSALANPPDENKMRLMIRTPQKYFCTLKLQLFLYLFNRYLSAGLFFM